MRQGENGSVEFESKAEIETLITIIGQWANLNPNATDEEKETAEQLLNILLYFEMVW